LPIEKKLAKKDICFVNKQKIIKNISSFAKRIMFSQEKIYVLPKEKI